MAVPLVSFAKGQLFLLRFACQAFLFVTFRLTCRKSFRVAGAILLHTFATFSGNVLQFSWQAEHFGCVHRHFAWQAHFRRVVLRAFANRIAKAALSGDKVQIPWHAWPFLRWDEN